MKSLNVAIVGATGLVGQTLIRLLESRRFPIRQLIPLASARSLGKTVRFEGKEIPIQNLSEYDFKGTDLAFFSAGSEVSKEYVPKATQAKCLVIDNTSHFRYESDVPLVIPEVNGGMIEHWRTRYLIANPNCSTIQMLMALYPLHQFATLKRIDVATYQAVSGAGQKAMTTLKNQSSETDLDEMGPFPVPIAFNVIPHIDVFQENGYTKEEMKMVWETHKILGDEGIAVNPTAVRIPVFSGHSEAIAIKTEKKLSAQEAENLLSRAPGIVVKNKTEAQGYPTPRVDGADQDAVFVGRIREDLTDPRGLNLWVVADNIRKGAALNSIQIAEYWLENYL